MKIGVLIDPESWYLRDLQRAAAGTHELVPLNFSDLWGNAESNSLRDVANLSPSAGTSCEALLVRTMPPGSLEQVVFRMDLLAQWEAAGCRVINPPRAMEAAVDKYLCSVRLSQAGLPIPPTVACQTWQQSMKTFELLGGDVVVKPIFGGEGRGIVRLEDPALALRSFQTLHRLQSVIYIQSFVPHAGFDYRVLVLGEHTHVIRRRNPHDWRTNLSLGATAEPVTETGPWIELGLRAAQAIGAPIAGVDILPGLDGKLYVLEVNAVPGWKGLQAATGHDIAREILAYVAASR
ncbi:MAG: RimK family alpha-L-glutamate ligase [Planctomycetota bacterium]|nr:RimK family alpha-L-glutamate ligase [Planctomycetota bacterium]MDA1180168.1 RimK family alpha-L-glutamate ligase [Planctomycetota bacterium]